MNRKHIIIIALVTAVAILTIIIIVFLLRPAPSPTPSPYISVPTPVSTELVLVSVAPPEDATGQKFYIPGTRIIYTFNKAVLPSTALIDVSPEIPLDTTSGDSPNQLIVQPSINYFWKPDVLYTITLKGGLKGIDGSVLQNDIGYRIMTRLQGGV